MANVKINVDVVTGAARSSVKALEAQTKSTTSAFKSLNLSVKSTTSAFKVFAGTIAAQAVSRLARGLLDLGASSLNAAKDLETITTQFEVLTKSAASADKLIRELQDFTARTPFRFNDVAGAAKQLLSFQFTAEEVKENLQALGDVSAASGANIKNLSLIFGQVSAAGKLTGERLLQLQERGIAAIGPAIAQQLSITEKEVSKAVSDGKVSFEVFEKAFQSLSQEGGFAFGGIEKASQTLQGRISTLQDNFEILQQRATSGLVPALKAIAITVTQIIQQFTAFISAAQGSAEISNTLINVVLKLASGFTFIIQSVQGFRAALSVMSAGLVAIVSTVLLAVEGIVKLGAAVAALTGVEFDGLNDAAQGLEDLRSSSQKTADSLLQDADELATSVVTTGQVFDGFTAKLKTNFAEEQASIEARKNSVVTGNKEIVASEQEKISLLQLLTEDAVIAADEQAEAEALRFELKGQGQFEKLVEFLGMEEAARIASQARIFANEGKVDKARDIIAKGRRKAAAEQTKREKEEQDKQLADRKSTLSTVATLQNSSNKTLAAIGKAAAITQIAIDTPVAISKALAAFPPPANFIAAGVVAAAMAVQAARVAGFENGGIVGGSSFTGDNVQARVNSGEMILNRQQQSQLFNMANGGGSGGAQTIQSNITVELDGEVVARAVSRQVADGLELGEVV